MGWKDDYIARYGQEAYEQRAARQRELYRMKRLQLNKKITLKDLIMTEKFNLPIPECDKTAPNYKLLRANAVNEIAGVFQKEVRRRWSKEMGDKHIITAEGICNVPKGIAIYTIECVLANPHTKEMRDKFKTICKEVVESKND